MWPDCVINVFGSQQTRMLTCTSDIDISILNVPTRDMSLQSSNQINNQLKTELECLYLLSNKLKELQMVSYVEVLGNAKVGITN
jgi:DNA polymerase sigma